MRRKAISVIFGAAAAVLLSGQARADISGFGNFGAVNSAGTGGSYSGGTTFTLTDGGGNEGNSGFDQLAQSIAAFNASFTYTATGGADGAAFILQNDPRGVTALGDTGGSLGYGFGNGGTPVGNSAAIEFNLYTGAGPVGTAFATNGATGRYTDSAPVVLNSGNPINVNVSYNGSSLSLQATDTVTSNSYSKTFTNISLPTIVGGNTALVGFSGGTGGIASNQAISNFTFQSVAPTVVPAAFKPIAISGGFDQDLVVEAAAGDARTQVTGTLDGGIGAVTGDTLYERGRNSGASATGLPHPGLLTSRDDPSHTYQLQSYAGLNSLLLSSANTTGTLTLSTPSTFSALSLLATTGGGENLLHLVIHHSNGAPDEITGDSAAPDWFGTDPTAVATAYVVNGRVNPTNNANDNTSFDNVNGNNPRLYDVDFTLTDTVNPISSVDVVWSSGGGRTGVFALSGVSAVPEPATLSVVGLGAMGLLARRRRRP
jgi:hypothetical protein